MGCEEEEQGGDKLHAVEGYGRAIVLRLVFAFLNKDSRVEVVVVVVVVVIIGEAFRIPRLLDSFFPLVICMLLSSFPVPFLGVSVHSF
jgi:hypothetical protein